MNPGWTILWKGKPAGISSSEIYLVSMSPNGERVAVSRKMHDLFREHGTWVEQSLDSANSKAALATAFGAMREALAIGLEMQAALERGRRLHPWAGVEAQRRAVRSEAEELIEAVKAKKSEPIYGEAVDCWVTARRIVEGR